ncbi:MAG: hypothetical protein KAQ70_05790, partial [Candidatus Heimdallarchaeota archaeon]|nr:hypothetical protein [Candidatus Heimdallarchaeota archaeon]
SDVDYKAFGQVSTFFFGRFVTPQDLRIVDNMLQSHPDARFIVEQLQQFKSGEFYVLSPDVFPEPVHINTRRLYSIHKTLSDEDVARMYDFPPATLCKQIGTYDHSIDSMDLEDISRELSLDDLEKELSSIRKFSSKTSLLDKQAGIDKTETDDSESETQPEGLEALPTETKDDFQEVIEKEPEMELIDLSNIIKSMKDQYLKYEPVEFKELLEKFFGNKKLSYLGTQNLELAYIPFLYLDFRIKAQRRIQVNYANADRWGEVTLDLPIKRIFPLLDKIELGGDEEIWGQKSIPIQAEEVFDELISVLPMKNLGSLYGAKSSNIRKLEIQRTPETILESFHDVLLVDETFYGQAWKKSIEEGLMNIEKEHKAEIDHWAEELQNERKEIFKAIDGKRKRVKKYQAQIEEAKGIYVALKPLMTDKYKFKSNRDVGDYNKALETIKFGPEVIK